MKKRIVLNLVMSFSIVSLGYAQEGGRKIVGSANLKIPYNQEISILDKEDSKWSIKNLENNSEVRSGIGTLKSFKFNSPGKYAVKIENVATTEHNDSESHECNHVEPLREIEVNVVSYDLEFDMKSIRFSDKITGGTSVEGINVTLDVILESFDGSDAVLTDSKLTTAGVGTTIVGQLISDNKLKKGRNKLTYKLIGEATKGSYIMFDFLDINGDIQSYSYPEMIQ